MVLGHLVTYEKQNGRLSERQASDGTDKQYESTKIFNVLEDSVGDPHKDFGAANVQ